MATDPLINRIFDHRYLIRRKLGSGGMAEVYLAEDQELGRKVALKMLNERHANDEQFVERFKREARNAAGLSHPNIVRIYDRGQAEGTYYIAMEYLDGPTLKELLVRKGPTPPLTAIKFAREILSALAEAHRNEIVHRDIKPHNVDRQPRLADQGDRLRDRALRRVADDRGRLDRRHRAVPLARAGARRPGRPALRPLLARNRALRDAHRQVPFTGDAPVEIAMKHLSAIPEPPSAEPESAPRARRGRHARAGEGSRPALPVGRGDGRRPRTGRPRRCGVAPTTEDAMTQVLAGEGLAAAPTMVSRSRTVTAPAGPARRPAGFRTTTRRATAAPLDSGRLLLGLLAIAIAAASGLPALPEDAADSARRELDGQRRQDVGDLAGRQRDYAPAPTAEG
jgi:hypothetical protein